jgi:hypothetical protein
VLRANSSSADNPLAINYTKSFAQEVQAEKHFVSALLGRSLRKRYRQRVVTRVTLRREVKSHFPSLRPNRKLCENAKLNKTRSDEREGSRSTLLPLRANQKPRQRDRHQEMTHS